MIPHVYQTVYPRDFTLIPNKVHKKFIIQRSQLYDGALPVTGSGYKLIDAIYPIGKLKLGTDSQPLYETNSFDGSYKAVIWRSIDSQYYRYPYDRYKTLEHSNPRFTYKFLNVSASIISIPYLDYGECIKPGSVELTASGMYFSDDGNGNLYDTSIETGSFPSNADLVAYWGFNDIFRKFQNGFKTLEKTNVSYKSHLFQPDIDSVVRNVEFPSGININTIPSGFSAHFRNDPLEYPYSSSIWTSNRPEFNFAGNSDFSISLFYDNESINDTEVLISKNTMISRQVFGSLTKYNQNGSLINAPHVSSSVDYDPINVYPYRIYFHKGVVSFERSDGINVVTLAGGEIEKGGFHHIGVVKSGSLLTMYIDGYEVTSDTDTTKDAINKHDILFGTDNIYNGLNGLNGKLDEVRFYNRALNSTEMYSLANVGFVNQSAYQTAACGNIFYKTGNIVLSGHDPTYSTLLNSDWTLKFRSTHVIYSYECLVRIPAGSFNISQNPSTLKNAYTDLIVDEMTGSLADGALFPYATAIGLYNEKKELVAVAKLSQALQMRDDVNLNIAIRWDS